MNTKATKTIVQPYLFFNGRCEEALNFYRQALGAELDMMMRFKDSPEPAKVGDAQRDKIMHASFRIGETTIMASDGCGEEKVSFEGFGLSVSVSTEEEAEQRFVALSKGGKVQMPLGKTFYAKSFGMVTDRFGILWMIIVPVEEPVSSQKVEMAH